MFRRIIYVIGLNLALVATFSVIMAFVPIPPGYYSITIMFYAFLGFGSAFVSLLMSRKAAKWSHKINVIDPLNPKSQTEKWLLDSVHQYARMAKLPKMPEVGIYQGNELNAFATGPTKSRSLVAVSSGLLSQMTKDEVEGVLGHEVAHIQNGDMVTMVMLQGTINTLVMIAARILADIVASTLSRSENGRGGGFFLRFALYSAFSMALGCLGMMITGTFSRYREYRADHGGARLAGSDKMIKSLQKLQMSYNPSVKANKETDKVAALMISGIFQKNSLRQLMSTHPPLDKRIQKLKSRQL